jgi:hypothetical protein
MAGFKEKEITNRFGEPDHKSNAGSMWYFKHMIYVKNRSNAPMTIKLLRIRKEVFEYYDDDMKIWKPTPMQNIPRQKYQEFVNKQAEEILLGEDE